MQARELVMRQLQNIYMLDMHSNLKKYERHLKNAEEYAITALEGHNNKYFSGSINPLNGVMYTNYLYWLSRSLFEGNNEEVASMVYGLNKMLHAVDLMYGIDLPKHWSCEHPLGAVMGRAEYGDYFFFYQGCTVGGNYNAGKLQYPTIGNNVKMYSNSKIIGDSHIGNNVIISANTYLINETVPDNSIVFGQSPNIIIKENKNV